MIGESGELARLSDRHRLTVAIPAKNEEALIERTLEALAKQTREDGSPLDDACFDVMVYCNDCDDATAALVRRFAARHPSVPVRAIEARLPSDAAHIGTARRAALDFAVDRFVAAGRSRGIVASTDADTVVAPTWVAALLREMRGVDAVAGFVRLSDTDRDAMRAPLRLLYDREMIYRRTIGLVESRFDPRPYDPPPRHASFVGANFAVTAAAYRRSGGLPTLPRLEDKAFGDALERDGARIRHSYDAYAFTSPRMTARVDVGFAALLSELSRLGEARDPYRVRSGRAIVEEAKARAQARADWKRIARAQTFGAYWETVRASAAFETYPDEPVEDAIDTLRRALAIAVPADDNVAARAASSTA